MSADNPVESKPAVAAIATQVAQVAQVAADPTQAALKAGWWFLRGRTRLATVLGTTALALAGGAYGYKHINTTPSKVAAQGEPPAVAQNKDEQQKTAKPPESSDFPGLTMPDIPPVPTVPSKPLKIDLELPDIKAPVLPPRPGDTGTAPLTLPVDIKKPPEGTDLFKAQDPLPMSDKRKPDTGAAPLSTDVKGRREKSDKEPMPVLRVGAQDKPPPPPAPATKKDDSLGLELPPLPPTPGAKLDDGKKDHLLIVSPPTITPALIPDVPSVPTKDKEIKAPEIGLPPVKVPAKDVPPTIALPKIPDLTPPLTPLPPTPTPPTSPIPTLTIEPRPPVPVPPTADKKDVYDEDWHTQRDGDTYTMISQEYLHDTKYAPALEAYNKDHRKAGERIIRVPPPWVLEEKYPGLIGRTDKPAVPEAKPTGNLKFESVAPLTSNSRPAPPPAAPSIPTPTGAASEYRVKNEAGETIREIARKVYGNDNAWKKLWDLNPNLDPTQPIPSGTTLRLAK